MSLYVLQSKSYLPALFQICHGRFLKHHHSDPPNLAFLEKVFLFAEPLKSLEKEGKTQEKARKIGKRKKQGNRKKQGLEGQGKLRIWTLRICGFCSPRIPFCTTGALWECVTSFSRSLF